VLGLTVAALVCRRRTPKMRRSGGHAITRPRRATWALDAPQNPLNQIIVPRAAV